MHVFTIPPSVPFLRTLVTALVVITGWLKDLPREKILERLAEQRCTCPPSARRYARCGKFSSKI